MTKTLLDMNERQDDDDETDPQGALCYQWGDEVRGGFINMLSLRSRTRAQAYVNRVWKKHTPERYVELPPQVETDTTPHPKVKAGDFWQDRAMYLYPEHIIRVTARARGCW